MCSFQRTKLDFVFYIYFLSSSPLFPLKEELSYINVIPWSDKFNVLASKIIQYFIFRFLDRARHNVAARHCFCMVPSSQLSPLARSLFTCSLIFACDLQPGDIPSSHAATHSRSVGQLRSLSSRRQEPTSKKHDPTNHSVV